jgi:hypothetical protein
MIDQVKRRPIHKALLDIVKERGATVEAVREPGRQAVQGERRVEQQIEARCVAGD